MLTNHSPFLLACSTLTVESRFSIHAKVRRVIDTDPYFLDDKEQATFILDRVFEIAQILTQLNPAAFCDVRDYLYKKLKIVRCDQDMCDYVWFKDTIAFHESIDRLKLIDRRIQNANVLIKTEKKIR